MIQKFTSPFQLRGRFASIIMLCAVWVICLTCGGLAAICADHSLLSLMRAGASSRTSIVGLLLVPLLPFLFSAIAVYFSYPWLIYSLCGVKAFCFGLCVCLVRLAFGSAGWMVQFLLLFTDCLTLPMLWWLWCLALSHTKSRWNHCAAGCLLWFLLITAIDWNLIFPFLKQIL